MCRFFFIFFSSYVFISACSVNPATQIEMFAESAIALTESTDELVQEYNRTTVHAQLRLMKIQHKPGGERLTVDALSSIENVFGDESKKKLAIYRANKAIQNYAKALKALAQVHDKKKFTQASVSLVGSLQGMETSYQTLSGKENEVFLKKEELGAIGAAFDLIGSTIVEEKRKKVLKQVIVKADGHIATLVDEVNKYIGDLGFADDIQTNNILIISNKIADYNRLVKRNSFKSNPEKQYRLLLSLWKENQKAIAIPKKVAHLQKALKEISTQHQKIKKEVVNDHFTSENIVRAAGVLKAMNQRYNDISNAIMTCDEVKVDDEGVAVCKDVTE